MADIEKSIATEIRDTKDVIGLNMEVSVTWATENDDVEISKIVAKINEFASSDERSELQGKNLDEIKSAIKQNLAKTNQPRVLNVIYNVELLIDGGTSRFLDEKNTGPDLFYGLTKPG